ncbi:hypothetical protein FGB62_69g296 [Gracilaria domingensis]|nr:hypothetical protein FGB62_69g296 [Gracilaria domingensis]
MVFIAIGALKAAKAAKREYDKDKKRSQIIAPLDNSRRNEFDNAPSSASPDWWSSDQPPEAEPQQPVVAHNSFGAWSRDQLIEQVSEQQSREEEYDTRFREQLSNSSASLGSGRVPSASHSPSHAVARTRSELEQAYSDGSPKQILPPAISAPPRGQDVEPPEATAFQSDASDSAPTVLGSKPPRPAKQSACVEGSYEAMLKSSSTSSEQKRHGASRAAGSSSRALRAHESSREDSISQLGNASRQGHGPELVEGSFESALRSGMATKRFPPKSSLSNTDGAYQRKAPSASAFPSSAKPKRLARGSSVPVHPRHPTTADSLDTEDGQRSQTLDGQALHNSAFANVSTAKGAIKLPQGSSNGSDVLQPVLSKTMRPAEGSNPVQATQGSAFRREGICTRTRRKPRDSTALGSRTIPVPTTAQGGADAGSTATPPNISSVDTAVGSSCMSAEGTMKKRRGRGPLHNN